MNDVQYFEIQAAEPEKAAQFYAAAFGWQCTQQPNMPIEYWRIETEGMPEFKSQEELDVYIGKLESDMREAAKKFEFEKAARLRDTVKELRTKEFLFA